MRGAVSEAARPRSARYAPLLRAPGRLAAVARYGALLREPDRAMSAVARLAAQVCAAPVAMITVLEEDWLVARATHGIAPGARPVDETVCPHLLLEPRLLVVPDCARDERTADSWLLRSDPPYRFYAGVPLRSPDGHVLGALCVLDTVPRSLLDERKDALVVLAEQAMRLLDLKDRTGLLTEQLAEAAVDASDLDVARRALARSIRHDSLTGLANRALLLERAEEALERAAATRSAVAALRLDLDGFTPLTARHGTHVSDAVLVDVARRLRLVAGPARTVARIGGDEFIVLCEQTPGGPPAVREARALGARLRDVLREPVVTPDGEEVTVTASFGLASVAGLGSAPEEVEELARGSGLALARAQALGGDRLEAFDTRLRQEVAAQARAGSALERAVATGDGLEVRYQPVVDLDSDVVVGLEALVRITAEDGSPQPTDLVIAAAEAGGLVVPLGAAVLQRACAQVAAWRRTSGRPLLVAVNLSPRQVARPDLEATVVSALAAAGLPPCALALEVTETALLEAAPTAIEALQRLRDRGVAVGVDDFGTGYASLRYLRELPLSFLKVDRSFVSGLPGDPDDTAIVTAVLGLARALRLDCVAEGIETPEQLTWLRAQGGVTGQGFLLGEPLTADEVAGMLAQQPVATAEVTGRFTRR